MSLRDLIKFPSRILQATALWPKSSVSSVYKLRTFFTLGLILSLTLCLTYNATFHFNDFIELSESLFMLISLFNTLMKVFMLYLNGKAFLKFLSMIERPSFRNSVRLYGSVFEDVKNMVAKVHRCYKIQVNGTVIFMSLCPALESKPLPMDFPHFNDGMLYYPFYVFEAVSLCVAAYCNMALDLLTVGVISVATIQLRILNRKLVDTEGNVENSGNLSEKDLEQLTLGYLNECCRHYSDIEEFVKCLSRVLSINIFVQLGTSVVAICNSGMLILTVNPLSVEAVSLFFYISTMLAQLGMYCWFGNFVYWESLEVTTSCYMSPWYLRGTPIKKTLFMLMERTKRPLQIKGINFVTLSFNTFIAKNPT
uniref:Odorant receptor n=1 Tax=Eucryptorrhynchus brandti TaxID=436910 RepID=A0A8F4MXM2_EUCBR|nr:odorant receptor 5 [Eucryptorrhynchus brandti]